VPALEKKKTSVFLLFREKDGPAAAVAAKSFRHKHNLPTTFPLFLCLLALIAAKPGCAP
jgi:hypothetical protein